MTSPFAINSTRSREFCQGKFSEYREQVGDWLSKFNWDWWATFTFRYGCSPYSAKRAFKRFFMPSAAYLCPGQKVLKPDKPDAPDIDYFYASEWHGDHHGVHIHALMGNCYGIRRLTTIDNWHKRYGRARVFAYDKRKGARYYLCKYILKSVADWDISIGKQSYIK